MHCIAVFTTKNLIGIECVDLSDRKEKTHNGKVCDNTEVQSRSEIKITVTKPLYVMMKLLLYLCLVGQILAKEPGKSFKIVTLYKS